MKAILQNFFSVKSLSPAYLKDLGPILSRRLNFIFFLCPTKFKDLKTRVRLHVFELNSET